jgi:hypothetical protein
MADAVTVRTIGETTDQIVVHLTNVSDGTGEAAVVKVDKSALVASDGGEPAALDIESVRWSIQGFTSVELLWDHTADDTALVLTGSGYEDFRCRDLDIVPSTARLKDPRSAGGAGDVLLTTNGAVAGATYDITLTLRKPGD